MYQGVRGRIKELLFCNLVPRFEKTLGARFLRTASLRLRPVGRGDYEGWFRTPPPPLTGSGVPLFLLTNDLWPVYTPRLLSKNPIFAEGRGVCTQANDLKQSELAIVGLQRNYKIVFNFGTVEQFLTQVARKRAEKSKKKGHRQILSINRYLSSITTYLKKKLKLP